MTDDSQPFVSVVTPFYNTERFLAEAIESVLRQTYANYEYILVNNCSTDGSARIAERYAAADSRIRLVHNDRFLSQVENYNHALRQISPTSRFCKVVQADDWIYDRCLEEMVGAAAQSANVALVSSYTLHDPEPLHAHGMWVGNAGLPYDIRLVPGREMVRRYLVDYVPVFGSPTCVMFRSSDIRAKRDFFHLDSPVEDIEACCAVLAAGDFAFVHQVLSFHRCEQGSTWWRLAGWDALELNKVIVASKYGPRVLDEQEWLRVERRVLTDHYRALGHAVLKLRPRAYWHYHASGLAGVGRRIRPHRLAWYVLRALVERLGNPKATIGDIVRAVRER